MLILLVARFLPTLVTVLGTFTYLALYSWPSNVFHHCILYGKFDLEDDTITLPRNDRNKVPRGSKSCTRKADTLPTLIASIYTRIARWTRTLCVNIAAKILVLAFSKL